MNRHPAVALDGVTFRFPDGDGPFRQPISYSIRPGEIVIVTGPNGIGKTTMLYLIAGLLTPEAGTVRVFGRDPRRPPARAGIGILFPGGRLLAPRLTLSQSVRIRSALTGTPRSRYEEEILASAALASNADRPVQELSTGTLRKAELAFAFAEAAGQGVTGLDRAGLILLDEPERSLDPVGRAEMLARLVTHARAGGTALVATPDEDTFEAANQILRLVCDPRCEGGTSVVAT